MLIHHRSILKNFRMERSQSRKHWPGLLLYWRHAAIIRRKRAVMSLYEWVFRINSKGPSDPPSPLLITQFVATIFIDASKHARIRFHSFLLSNIKINVSRGILVIISVPPFPLSKKRIIIGLNRSILRSSRSFRQYKLSCKLMPSPIFLQSPRQLLLTCGSLSSHGTK